MILYRVVYLDANGKQNKKLIEVEDEAQLQPYLTAMELNVISVHVVPAYVKKFDFRNRTGKIKTAQVIEILENLQVIVHSGLSMNSALVDMAKDADTKQIGDILVDISHRIQMAMSLSDAMGKYQNIFGETTIGLVRIGEETGQLDETLQNAADYMGRIEGLTSKVKSALILPIITLVALFAAMGFWMVAVMPQLIEAFESFELDLPFFTRFFMAMSDVIRAHILKMIIVIVALIVTLKIAHKRSRKFEFFIDKYMLKMPVIGNILQLYNYAFVAEYTRLMIAAGLPLFQALGILQESTSNLVFKTAIQNARQSISSGSSLSTALAEQKLFTPLVIRMVAVGEQTGRLEGQLHYVSNYYFKKVDYISDNIAKVIQPVITVVLGLFMVVMMLAFIMPIADMVSNIAA